MAGSKKDGKFTGYGLAKKLGISKQSVYKALSEGRLTADDNKRIDPENELTISFIKFHEESAPAASESGRGRPIKGGNAPPIDFSGAEALLAQQRQSAGQAPPAETAKPTNIVDQSRQMDVTLKRIKAAKEQVFYHELIKKVVPFEVAARLFNIVSSSIEQEFRNFDQQNTEIIVEAVIDCITAKLLNHGFTKEEQVIVDRVLDVLKGGIESSPVATTIREEIERGIQAVKRTAHQAIEQLREGE